jgi:hypothetical protein
MRIDNQSFEDLLNKKGFGLEEESIKTKKSQNDPFS